MRYPVWLIVRAQGLVTPPPLFLFLLLLNPIPLFLTYFHTPPESVCGWLSPLTGTFFFLTACSNLPDNMDRYQLCLHPAAFVDFLPLYNSESFVPQLSGSSFS